ncbi:MAG: hypothetical protein CMN78_05685 [Spirochaetales bacterium]|nr:hypothetical protein [Spirochaetales bacterium]
MNSWKRSIFVLTLVLFAALSGVYAGGNKEIPQTELYTSGTQYISPNGDDIQEEATIEFEVTVYVKSDEGYVPEYGISLTDASGNIIRQVVETEEPDIGWFLRLFRRWQAFTLEKSLTWDGTDEEGNIVNDGIYIVTMWVVAGSEQRSEDLKLDEFVVDNTPPEVTVTQPEPMIFSPNNDGNLEDVSIAQSDGSSEDLWEGVILDEADTTVKTYYWENAAPETFTWYGKNDENESAPDGVYSYRITATDRAGNSFESSFDGIELSTVETPISISFDGKFISPNDDGAADSLGVTLQQDVGDGIVDWKLFFADDEGVTVRTFEGEGDPPPEVSFDGMNDDGDPVPEGLLRAIYELNYRHGNNPTTSDLFEIDVTKPEITVTVVTPIISPNADNIQDKAEVSFKSNEIVTWTGEITDSSDNTVLATSSEQTTSLIVWRGEGADGALLPDGEYFVNATFTDRAGNPFSPETETLSIDVTPPAVEFSVDRNYFSPDGDGIKDSVTARFAADEPVRSLLLLKDASGQDVKTFGGLGRTFEYITGEMEYQWEGMSGSELKVPDGDYEMLSSCVDRGGNRIDLPAVTLTIDTREVSLSVSAPKGFSPNGDDLFDTVLVDIDASFYDTVVSWGMGYRDAAGKVAQLAEGKGELPRQLEWNGGMQFASDVTASEGIYNAVLQVEYLKGDVVEAISGDFFVDVTPPAVNLQATADPFIKSNGDMEGDIYITLQIDDAHEVMKWALDVLTNGKNVVRSFAGSGDLEDQLMWREGSGTRVSRVPITDRVTLKVNVVDEVGNGSVFETEVPLDLLVVRRDEKLYLLVPNVIFGEYQHELDSRSAEDLEQNLASIEQIFEIFQKYTGYELLLEGHALNVHHRGDPDKEAEEEEILIPLTQKRAETVRDALIELGMAQNRIRIEWFGGKSPIMDVLDKEVRWKNRRVEFIMLLNE